MSNKTSELENVIRAHKDLVYSMHKSLLEISNTMKFKMDALTDEIKFLKSSAMLDPKYVLDMQERRHTAEVDRIISLLTKHDTIKFSGDFQNAGQKNSEFTGASAKSLSIVQPKDKTVGEDNLKKNEDSEGEDDFVPDTHFEPVIPLPNLVEAKTGEEDEKVLFVSRCKLYRYDRTAKEQKERGVGELKVLKHKETGRVRCLMRRDQILNLCANFPISAGMTITQKSGSPTIYNWHCVDFSQSDKPDGENEIFTVRFKEPTVAADFAAEFRKAAASVAESPKKIESSAENKETTSMKLSNASGTVAAKKSTIEATADIKNKPMDVAKSNGLATNSKVNFSFGTSSSNQSFASLANKPSFNFLANTNKNEFTGANAKSFSIVQPKDKTVGENNLKKNEDSESEDDFVPDIHFEPVIPLPNLVEAKTGEEDEEVLFVSRCKLYRYDRTAKEQKERGVGELKVLKHKETGRVRCLMRRDQILNLCANFPISAGMTITQKSGSPTIYNWHCVDFSQSDKPDGENEIFTARFKEPTVAADFAAEFRKAAASTVAESPKKIESSAENKETTSMKLSNASGTVAAKTIEATADIKNKPTDVAKSNGLATNSKVNFSFGTSSSNQSFASLANKPSFNFLANTNKNEFTGANAKSFSIFQPKDKTVGADKLKKNEDSEGEDDFVPDTHFEPVIPLPNLVEAKTGEEDEEVLFVSRCKLYRYDRTAKEQKERGVGELKVLKHKETGRVRCLMRRDQILNLCANFPISAGMTITQKSGSPTIYNWHCVDFSQSDKPDGENEIFTARFKEPTVAADFAAEFRKAAA